MKILIVSPFENEHTGRGGRNVDLADKLSSHGAEVTFATSNFDHGSKRTICNNKFDARVDVLNIIGYRKNISLSRLLSHIQFSYKLVSKYRKKRFDIIFCSTIPPELVLACTLLKKERVVYDVRDIWPDALINYSNLPKFITRIFSAYCYVCYSIGFRHKADFTLVAPTFLNWLKRYCLKPTWKFIPLGFRSKTWADNQCEDYQYDFMYAGGITPQFNLTEFGGRLYGKVIFLGDGSMVDEVSQRFPDAEMPGVVPRQRADNVMKNTKTLLLPSNLNARLPNKAFDYFASNQDVLLGDNVSREIRYLFKRIYPNRRMAKSQDEFRVLSRSYVTEKLAAYLEGKR